MARAVDGRTGPLSRLPAFPWDSLQHDADLARTHPDGIVDLSVGTPVDDTPEVVQRALVRAANSPGYPTTQGSLDLREAAVDWMVRSTRAIPLDPNDVLPVIGTKEVVAWLPTMLGLGAGDRVVVPELAYPTYDVGARMAGAEPVVSDSLTALGPGPVSLVWLNSPSNPTGRVLPVDHMRKVVDWARERGALVVSDECYIELGWTQQPVSVLDPAVCGGSTAGVITVHSLSKRSNLAGYRFGFVAGDPRVVRSLLELRKHAGMMVPGPVQAAAAAGVPVGLAAGGRRPGARPPGRHRRSQCGNTRRRHPRGRAAGAGTGGEQPRLPDDPRHPGPAPSGRRLDDALDGSGAGRP